jgi:uncharacterized membrane protein YfcA
MSLAHFLAILLAGAAAGTINTVVGSGSLITFPTLVALGYPARLANVSNNIGLVPGSMSGVYGYRRELKGQSERLKRLMPASALGGLSGAVLLLVLDPKVFGRVVIVLVLVAISLVIAQPWVSRRVLARRGVHAGHRDVTPGLAALVCGAGVYGGYFGAAQGILLISVLGILLDDELQRLNACKNVLALTVNGVASIVFVFTTNVDWKVVGTIAVGSTIGGQIGARIGRRLNPALLRAAIVLVGITALVVLVLKR